MSSRARANSLASGLGLKRRATRWHRPERVDQMAHAPACGAWGPGRPALVPGEQAPWPRAAVTLCRAGPLDVGDRPGPSRPTPSVAGSSRTGRAVRRRYGPIYWMRRYEKQLNLLGQARLGLIILPGYPRTSRLVLKPQLCPVIDCKKRQLWSQCNKQIGCRQNVERQTPHRLRHAL